MLTKYFATPGNFKFNDFIMASGLGAIKLVCDRLPLSEDDKTQLQNFTISPCQS
jgi:hypothetical protein